MVCSAQGKIKVLARLSSRLPETLRENLFPSSLLSFAESLAPGGHGTKISGFLGGPSAGGLPQLRVTSTFLAMCSATNGMMNSSQASNL